MVAVRPVVTYPGWYVEDPPKGVRSGVWVLNPKVIPAFTFLATFAPLTSKKRRLHMEWPRKGKGSGSNWFRIPFPEEMR